MSIRNTDIELRGLCICQLHYNQLGQVTLVHPDIRTDSLNGELLDPGLPSIWYQAPAGRRMFLAESLNDDTLQSLSSYFVYSAAEVPLLPGQFYESYPNIFGLT